MGITSTRRRPTSRPSVSAPKDPETTRTAAVALALTSACASAQITTPRADARKVNREVRIDRCTASGALTAPETRRLEHGHVRVDRIEGRAKAGGAS